jgi:hypothetical protein
MRGAVFALSAAVLLVAGCSGPASVKAAREKVDLFHKQFNAGEYGAIWDGAGAEIQSSSPKEQFVQGLEGVHQFWGDAKATTQVSWGYSDNDNGSYSKVVMKTDFEKGRAYETFAFRNFGEEQKLAEYAINKNPPPSDAPSGSASASAAPSAPAAAPSPSN